MKGLNATLLMPLLFLRPIASLLIDCYAYGCGVSFFKNGYIHWQKSYLLILKQPFLSKNVAFSLSLHFFSTTVWCINMIFLVNSLHNPKRINLTLT